MWSEGWLHLSLFAMHKSGRMAEISGNIGNTQHSILDSMNKFDRKMTIFKKKEDVTGNREAHRMWEGDDKLQKKLRRRYENQYRKSSSEKVAERMQVLRGGPAPRGPLVQKSQHFDFLEGYFESATKLSQLQTQYLETKHDNELVESTKKEEPSLVSRKAAQNISTLLNSVRNPKEYWSAAVIDTSQRMRRTCLSLIAMAELVRFGKVRTVRLQLNVANAKLVAAGKKTAAVSNKEEEEERSRIITLNQHVDSLRYRLLRYSQQTDVRNIQTPRGVMMQVNIFPHSYRMPAKENQQEIEAREMIISPSKDLPGARSPSLKEMDSLRLVDEGRQSPSKSQLHLDSKTEAAISKLVRQSSMRRREDSLTATGPSSSGAMTARKLSIHSKGSSDETPAVGAGLGLGALSGDGVETPRAPMTARLEVAVRTLGHPLFDSNLATSRERTLQPGELPLLPAKTQPTGSEGTPFRSSLRGTSERQDRRRAGGNHAADDDSSSEEDESQQRVAEYYNAYEDFMRSHNRSVQLSGGKKPPRKRQTQFQVTPRQWDFATAESQMSPRQKQQQPPSATLKKKKKQPKSKEVVDYVERRGQLLPRLDYDPERVIKMP
jgi:hypothetical protein